MKRASGVLLPVFSLPGPYGCGDLGDGATRWIDFLAKSGFSYWQVLPLCPTDGHFSPYMSCASLGGNPLFISPALLYKEGLITEEERKDAESAIDYACDYEALSMSRLPLLKKAASRFADKTAMDAFYLAHPELDEVCRYMADGQDGEALFEQRFMQYEFRRQWDALHAYAAEKGVRIIGDLPFYVSRESADVRFHPEQFLLDKKGEPKGVAGVPPDYFSKDGQLWGNPLYDFKRMEADGFSYFRARIRAALELFDGVRIDHFRAAAAYWSVPAGAKTAREGRWEKGPGMALCKALREEAGEKLLIAENLGIIDDSVTALLKESGFPGMAVFQFGFDGNPDNPHLPHNYENNLVAYTGTHDNNTLLGFLWELDEGARRSVFAYLGRGNENWEDACRETIRTLLMSAAGLCVFPAQDLLVYGADTRVNTPGRAEGNWRYRLTEQALASLNAEEWLAINHRYGRI